MRYMIALMLLIGVLPSVHSFSLKVQCNLSYKDINTCQCELSSLLEGEYSNLDASFQETALKIVTEPSKRTYYYGLKQRWSHGSYDVFSSKVMLYIPLNNESYFIKIYAPNSNSLCFEFNAKEMVCDQLPEFFEFCEQEKQIKKIVYSKSIKYVGERDIPVNSSESNFVFYYLILAVILIIVLYYIYKKKKSIQEVEDDLSY